MISAIILAAGRSLRMGQPKMLLPWGETTVLGKVITTLQRVGIHDVVVVTGGMREQVEHIAQELQARVVQNEQYKKFDMLHSIQCGLLVQNSGIEASLICLGDQPQIEEESIQGLWETYENTSARLVIPSYRMHRGHPWLIARSLWSEILDFPASRSPRDFLNLHADEIEYRIVDTPTIIMDLDTPEDYLKYKP